MKVSKNWLLESINLDISCKTICQQLTNAGLEVDEHLPVAPKFSGVVVAEIMSATRHFDADKLQVCEVNVGDGLPRQIICGAPNARAGIKVALATIGAVLPGNFKIKKAKLRGVESFGMLCSEKELGLSEASVGILELPQNAPVGTDIRDYLDLNDEMIDIDLTPNRGDCTSVRGLVRELGVINNAPVAQLEVTPVAVSHQEQYVSSIEAVEACPKYLTRVIKQVDLNVVTPIWMAEKLRRSGIRSINPVVDVTNYVMIELGQPMHAFDKDKLEGDIKVRFAKADETLTLLNGNEVSLSSDTLVIADQNAAIAMAGIMGGEGSSVTDSTRDIVLESAFFNPVTIMGKARRYDAQSDSSYRFERGVDSSITELALERASQLIVNICGGSVGPIHAEITENCLPTSQKILLRKSQLARLLGFSIEDASVFNILERLGMQVAENSEGWQVETPLHRFDLSIEADLIEEVARIYGYQNIPSILPKNDLTMLPKSERKREIIQIKQQLVTLGYHETLSYSFLSEQSHQRIAPSQPVIQLTNPISSDLDTMRTSLWGNLVDAVVHNQHHQIDRVRLFEVGRVFLPQDNGTVEQPVHIAGVASGSRLPEQWDSQKIEIDFFDVKQDILALVPHARFQKAEHFALHPGQSAQVILHGEPIGWLGVLHPRIAQQFKLAQSVVLFELKLEAVKETPVVTCSSIRKYPSIRRDLALLVEDSVEFASVYDIVAVLAGNLLVDVSIFDIYRGEGVPAGMKSMAFAINLQHPERTLVDDEVNQLITNIVDSLKNKLNAELR